MPRKPTTADPNQYAPLLERLAHRFRSEAVNDAKQAIEALERLQRKAEARTGAFAGVDASTS
jgi:hypothetical protein